MLLLSSLLLISSWSVLLTSGHYCYYDSCSCRCCSDIQRRQCCCCHLCYWCPAGQYYWPVVRPWQQFLRTWRCLRSSLVELWLVRSLWRQRRPPTPSTTLAGRTRGGSWCLGVVTWRWGRGLIARRSRSIDWSHTRATTSMSRWVALSLT